MVHEIILGRSDSNIKKYGTEGTIYIGKQYITMGKTTSLAGRVLLDVVNPHVILVAGKRGGGKCLTGDTLITLENGLQAPIKELQKNSSKVLGINNKLKIESMNKTEFFKREVKEVIRLTLRSGKEIKLTPEHPLLTINGWKPVQELEIGSKIATPRKIKLNNNYQMPEHEIKLLAYLVAEGHLSNNFVLFNNMEQKLLDEFKECLKKFDISLKMEEYSKLRDYKISQRKVKHSSHQISCNSLKNWIKKMGLKLSGDKFLPDQIMKLNNDNLSLFLNRIFTCDGTIYKTSNRITVSYASKSEKLIRQIQHLLLRFDILSKLRRKTMKLNGKIFPSFELEIGDPANVKKFIKNIGFFGTKKEKQEVFLKELWEHYTPENLAAIGYKHTEAMREHIRYSSNRNTLMKIAQFEKSELLMALADSDIFWDEIKSMELLKGDFEVYDITVPEYHNFIANDIIVHNSYSLGVMGEGIASLPDEVARKISCLFFDTMGIYWTMKFANVKDDDLLYKWEMESKGYDEKVKIYVPKGKFDEITEKNIPVDKPFSIGCNQLTGNNWNELLGIEPLSQVGILITRATTELLSRGKKFGIDDIIELINSDERSERHVIDAAVNSFEAAKSWGIFSKEGTDIYDVLEPGRITVLDISMYAHSGAFSVRALIIGLLSRRILEERMIARKLEELDDIEKGWRYFKEEFREEQDRQVPLVWIFIDEAHEFLPREGSTLASNSLIQLIREGRQPGISLVLATQQPGKIHTDVITQSDLVLSHRLTAKIDIDALDNVMQTYLSGGLRDYLAMLPAKKGSAIILDDKQEKIYPVQIRPRMTWHGGGEPALIKPKRKRVGEL